MRALALAWIVGVLAACAPGGSAPATRTALGPAAFTAGSAPPLAGAGSPAPAACSLELPAAEPLPESVTMGDFWRALAGEVTRLDASALRGSYEQFAAHHGVDASTPELWQEFTKLWVAFEATRDGGWWRLRWKITDQEPTSTVIWKAWFRTPPQASFASASTVAECDEITSLFAITARHLGVRGVGLFYPTWNHVIAGWSPRPFAEQRVKGVVLIPTTQIFQGCDATFDRTTFKPPQQVYEFPKVDVKDSVEMPRALAEFLLEQVRAYAPAAPELLALIRTKRAELLQSSLGDCSAYRGQLAAQLASRLTCADRRALHHLATRELGRTAASAHEMLAYLAEP
jgi:hypothetical protein